MEIEVDFSGTNFDERARNLIALCDESFGKHASDFVEAIREWLDEGKPCTKLQVEALQRVYEALDDEDGFDWGRPY